MIEGRLRFDGPGSGAWNMAVDQAILDDVDQGAPPTLRFYSWDSPTLSLGYFQALAARAQHAASRDAVVVRRATGGGAILHDREITCSLCVPIRDRASSEVREIYDSVHRAIAAAVADFGIRLVPYALSGSSRLAAAAEPFLCFQRRTDADLVLDGYKVVGSAQRRSARAVLQHGSILLGASRWAPELPGMEELTSIDIDPASLSRRIAHHLGAARGIQWKCDHQSPEHHAQAHQWVTGRFGNPEWTSKR